ncbi:type II secretion system protein GspL [Novosphingobium huizhouense]|uniref:type II secretion system protein GspL n=1 Tax=Novosphingobium huizhouense TaxID=2866625 RepID=UPI001CD90317|nr:type II secretion system protein GspL [Novosphingobium huizhouense]
MIALLPERPGAPWHWWPVEDDAVGEGRDWSGGQDAPWPPGSDGVLLVPAAASPVTDGPLPDLPVAQALAAARFGAARSELGGDRHVAVAARQERLLTASVGLAQMDEWTAAAAASGLAVRAVVPAALVLPRPHAGAVVATLGGQALARTAEAAFAAEPELVEALAAEARALDPAECETALLAVHRVPPLDLRQGRYAPARVSFLTVADWRPLARLAASAALLGLLAMSVLILRWTLDSDARERRAVEHVQRHFASVADLAQAEQALAAAAAREGRGPRSVSAPLAALLGAMRAAPGVRLRDLAFDGQGTLAVTASAPGPDQINAVLVALQRDGWKVTVPPGLAPDPTGATVAAITVTAP